MKQFAKQVSFVAWVFLSKSKYFCWKFLSQPRFTNVSQNFIKSLLRLAISACWLVWQQQEFVSLTHWEGLGNYDHATASTDFPCAFCSCIRVCTEYTLHVMCFCLRLLPLMLPLVHVTLSTRDKNIVSKDSSEDVFHSFQHALLLKMDQQIWRKT